VAIGTFIQIFRSATVLGKQLCTFDNHTVFSGFGLHSGENISGSVAVEDKRCFDRLINQIERKSVRASLSILYNAF
jgi:hypothetical protein